MMYSIIENEDIGNRIMALRLQHGYTREVLAERLNITWQHLANIEKGRRRVTIDILAGLYEHLHISPRITFFMGCLRQKKDRNWHRLLTLLILKYTLVLNRPF